MDQTPDETLTDTLANSFAKPKPSKHGRARTLVYVAGPFSGKGATRAEQRADTEQKIGRAARLGLQVSKLGAYPVVPHSNTSLPEYEDVQGYEFWIEGTGELLARCDAVIFTPDWQESSGARGEERIAAEIGIPRFYTLSDLACWLLPGLAVKTGEAVPVLDAERVHVVTEANRGRALTGHHWDRIEVRCQLTPDELTHLRTRLTPGGTLDIVDVEQAGYPSTLPPLNALPEFAEESSLAEPFGDFTPADHGFDEERFCGKMPSGVDVVFDDEPGTSPEIPFLRSARPNTGV